VDRQVLAKSAFFLTVKVLEDSLNSLTGVREPCCSPLLHASRGPGPNLPPPLSNLPVWGVPSLTCICDSPQVSGEPSRAPAPSMGEMTTADSSSRPSAEDGKHSLPKKPGFTEGPSSDAGPCEAPGRASLGTHPPGSDKPDKPPESQLATAGEATSSAEGPGAPGPEEPMEMDPGHWRRPSALTEPQGHPAGPEASRAVAETGEKLVAEASRTADLSLEELSISSRQQQLQAPVAKAPGPVVGAGGGPGELGLLRRPNRKRKLLEDVESGKTLLLDAYRVWQQGQKVMTYDLARIEKIMSETYMLIKQVCGPINNALIITPHCKPCCTHYFTA